MIRYRFKISLFCLLLFVLLLAGCLGRNSPEVTYFSLSTMASLGKAEALGSFPDIALGVGPVTIPDSLKRSQIATRQHGNQYRFDEFNRWAGILEKDFATVLGDNLGQLLGIDKVFFFPWMPSFKPDYRIMVDIQRFDGTLGGEAALSARWTVSSADGKEVLSATRSDYRQPIDGFGFDALVKAESQLVAALSQDIAARVITLQK